MKKMQWLPLFLALLLCLSLFVGCGKTGPTSSPGDNTSTQETSTPTTETPDEIVELTMAYWANAAEQANFEALTDGIENEYPNIRIKHQVYPSSSEFWAAVPVALVGGNGPDIIAFSDEGNAEYMANGQLAPLEDLFIEAGFDQGKFLPSLWSGWTYDGHIYGVPYDTSTSMISINKDMMDAAGIEKAPETMEELIDAAVKMNSDSTAGVCLWIMEFHLMQYIHAFGGDWGNGKTIDTPENVAGLQYVVDLFTKYNVAKTPQELSADWDGDAFAKGLAAMSTGGPWYAGFLKDANPELNYIAIPIPVGTVAAQSAYSHGLSVTAQSKYPLEAVQAIKYMTRDEAQISAIEAVGYCPAVEALIPQYVESMPNLKAIYDALPTNGVPFSYPVQTAEFNAELCAGMEQIIFDSNSGLTVEALLQTLQQKYGT